LFLNGDDRFSSFLPEDPKEAKRIFNTLPAEQQLEIVLKTRGKERIRTLFLSDHAEALIQRIPELEVFKNGLKNALGSIEADDERRIHLLAFEDFCLDLFEEEFGRIPPEEEIDSRFIKGLLMRI